MQCQPIPVGFSMWEGRFTSTQYGESMVNGTIKILIKDDIDINEIYDTAGTIKYNGKYRQGEILKFKCEVAESCLPHYVSFIFYTTIGNQSIRYVPSSISEAKISGEYISEIPSDTGSFLLTKTNV